MYQGVKVLQGPLMVMLGPRDSGKPPKLNQIWFLMRDPSICIFSFSVDPRVKKCLVFHVWSFKLLKFYDQIHGYVIARPSSCTYITWNVVWECLFLMKSWDCEFDHLKDRLYPQSWLLNFPLHDQLLILLMNYAIQICLPYLAHRELSSIIQSINKISQMNFLCSFQIRKLMFQPAHLIIPISSVTFTQLIIFPTTHSMVVALYSLIFIF